MKTRCKYKAEYRLSPHNTWIFRTLCDTHTHGAINIRALPQGRRGNLSKAQSLEIISMHDSGRTPSDILSVLRHRDGELYVIDAYNINNVVLKVRI